MSTPEVKRISEAAHFMKHLSGSVFVTIGVNADAGEVGDKVKNRVVKFQRDHDCPAYWFEVLSRGQAFTLTWSSRRQKVTCTA